MRRPGLAPRQPRTARHRPRTSGWKPRAVLVVVKRTVLQAKQCFLERPRSPFRFFFLTFHFEMIIDSEEVNKDKTGVLCTLHLVSPMYDHNATSKPTEGQGCNACVVLCHCAIRRVMYPPPQSRPRFPPSPRRTPLCCPVLIALTSDPRRDPHLVPHLSSSSIASLFWEWTRNKAVWYVTF